MRTFEVAVERQWWRAWPSKGTAWVLGRTPVAYRVLSGQFLLRIVELESLSLEADIPRFLGQFAGVLIMLSLLHALFALIAIGDAPWMVEQYLIRTTMLVSGLVVVVSWESTFPDRIDVMVLGPLPLKPAMVPLAKVSAVCALLGMAVLSLNLVPGLELPLLPGPMHQSTWSMVRTFGAYWLTMVLASVFLYCTVLTTQGTLALALPRQMFLKVSALREARSTATAHAVTVGFLLGSVMMAALAVKGLRSLFSLPLSLHANWVWRLTEFAGSERYLRASRTVLLLFGVLPVCLFAAVLASFYRPWAPAMEHVAILALLGCIFAELSLLRFRKVPFACSYLPGKANMQAVFWTAVLFLLPLATVFSMWEVKVLAVPIKAGTLVAALCATELGLWMWNQNQARGERLDFDDAEADVVLTLGLRAE